MALIIYMIHDAIILYIVDNFLIFEGQTQVKHIASKIFNCLFIPCIDNTFDELYADFETYAALT